MASAPQTRPSLLVRIRDAGDRAAWVRFVEIYAPLVYRFARRHGLQDADAADLTQEVLQAIAGASRRLEYDPSRGSFRGWLFTVARNHLRNFLARQRRYARAQGQSADGTDWEAVQDTREEELWEREHRQRLFAWAAERVRGEFHEATWQAFWGTAVEARPARGVADALGMSVGAVYVARSRVLARLREQIREVTDE